MGDFENALHRGRTEACKKMDRNKNRRCRNQQCIQAHLTSVDLWEGKLKNWKCSRVTVKTIAGVINEVFFFCFLFCRGSFIKTWTVHWDCQPFPLPLHQEQRWISPRAVCTLWSKNKGFCVYVCVCAHYCISNRYLISYLTLWWRKRAFVGFFFSWPVQGQTVHHIHSERCSGVILTLHDLWLIWTWYTLLLEGVGTEVHVCDADDDDDDACCVHSYMQQRERVSFCVSEAKQIAQGKGSCGFPLVSIHEGEESDVGENPEQDDDEAVQPSDDSEADSDNVEVMWKWSDLWQQAQIKKRKSKNLFVTYNWTNKRPVPGCKSDKNIQGSKNKLKKKKRNRRWRLNVKYINVLHF